MNRFLKILLPTIAAMLILSACGGGGGVSSTPTEDYPYDGEWVLVWSDEFNQPDQPIDSSSWSFDVGGGGWGNNQKEFDTNRIDNTVQTTDGDNNVLAIIARRENYNGKEFTSARVKTQGKREFKYGRFEARMKLPYGKGIWPAFWMLGANIASTPWPDCGEIDIMENIGKAENNEQSKTYGTVHGPGYSGEHGIGGSYTLPGGAKFYEDYHIFRIDWEPGIIKWYLDNQATPYRTFRTSDVPSGKRWVFDHKFFIILNLAVGGIWPGDPDGTTTFPQTFYIDYVRVYQRQAVD